VNIYQYAKDRKIKSLIFCLKSPNLIDSPELLSVCIFSSFFANAPYVASFLLKLLIFNVHYLSGDLNRDTGRFKGKMDTHKMIIKIIKMRRGRPRTNNETLTLFQNIDFD
jgi:hypothetical protein